jgi:cell division protein ZapA
MGAHPLAQVTVTINDRNYTVACGDGEEQHLLDLASYYDKQIRILSEELGQVGDTRLLLLGALMIADQLSDMVGKVDELRSEVNRLKGERSTYEHRAAHAESRVAEVLDAASRRVSEIAERLEAS